MPDEATTNTDEKAKAKNRLWGLIADEVSGVGAGANRETDWVIMKTGEQSSEDASKAVWSTSYINDLPDSAFLLIESGGKKDDEGKTTPRSLRHLPYKDKDGKVDIPHTTNAIARAPQLKVEGLSQEDKEKLQERARAILEDASKSDAKKSADTDGEENPEMPDKEPVQIEKSEDMLDRARDILWSAMDKLKERFYPQDEAARESVLDAVITAVKGQSEVLMSDDTVEKASDIVAEALSEALKTDDVAKAIFAIGPRPVAPTAEPESEPAPEPVPEPESVKKEDTKDDSDVEKAGKKQMSNNRARKWRSTMAAMVKLLHEMDPSLEKEALWPAPAAKSDDNETPVEPEKSEVEKQNEALAAENARLKAEVAKAKRRPAPSNMQVVEEPTKPVEKNKFRINRMDINEGLGLLLHR